MGYFKANINALFLKLKKFSVCHKGVEPLGAIRTFCRNLMKTLEALQHIELDFSHGRLPKARPWGGADVVISARAPRKSASSDFYPEHRYVISPHAPELSWLFGALRDAFYAEKRLDGQTKIEFFGRLANAANRCLTKSPDVSARGSVQRFSMRHLRFTRKCRRARL